MEKEVGKCKALFPRWYYDNSLNECQEFVFGGCGGNKNNFESKAACLQKCGMYLTFNP